MKHLKNLLKDLGDKIDHVRHLSELIIEFTQANQAYEALSSVVGILADPEGKIDKYTTGFVAARAEEMLDVLDKYERRFLISLSTLDAMRARIGALHEETPLRKKVGDAITVYDIFRVNPKTSIPVLRNLYLEMHGLMVRAEAQSRRFCQRDFHKLVDSKVVGSIKPARHNKAKARAKSAEHREFVVKHNHIRTA